MPRVWPRCIKLMRVVGDEICFNQRGVRSVYDIFYARNLLYEKAYFHKATRVLHRTVLYCMVQFSTVPYCTVLDCAVMSVESLSGSPLCTLLDAGPTGGGEYCTVL